MTEPIIIVQDAPQDIIKENDTTFKSGTVDLAVEIGDSKQVDFFPQIKMMKWDNHANISMRLSGQQGGVITEEPDKISYQKGDVVCVFIPITEKKMIDIGDYTHPREEHSEGAFEFSVTFLSPPATNILTYTLNYKNVIFYYQPFLTEDELIAKEIDRPQYVEGSYAIYHDSKKDNEFKAGKLGHIYRPIITDANGEIVLGTLDIQNDILIVTIPQKFLDTATYPVTVR